MNYSDDQVISDAYDFLTAHGLNSIVEAAAAWNLGAEHHEKEAKENGWEPKGDWFMVWEEVLDALAVRFHEDDPELFVHGEESGKEVSVGEATLKQSRDYLSLQTEGGIRRLARDLPFRGPTVKQVGAWVDGALFGHPGKEISIY